MVYPIAAWAFLGASGGRMSSTAGTPIARLRLASPFDGRYVVAHASIGIRRYYRAGLSRLGIRAMQAEPVVELIRGFDDIGLYFSAGLHGKRYYYQVGSPESKKIARVRACRQINKVPVYYARYG